MRLTNKMKSLIIKQIMDDVPRVDYAEQARVWLQEFYTNRCPPVIQQILADKNVAHHIKHTNKYVMYPVGTIAVPGNHDGVLPDKAAKKMAELNELLSEQNAAASKLMTSLKTAFAGINTRKKALAMFPEFEKYLPEEDESIANLPTVMSVIPALVEAGWPKDRKPAVKPQRKKAA
jgi:hypothetical protein